MNKGKVIIPVLSAVVIISAIVTTLAIKGNKRNNNNPDNNSLCVTENENISDREASVSHSSVNDISSNPPEQIRNYIIDCSTSVFNEKIYRIDKDADNNSYQYSCDTSSDELFCLSVTKRYDDDSELSVQVIIYSENSSYSYEAICKYTNNTSLTGCTYDIDSSFSKESKLVNPYDKYINGQKENYTFIEQNAVSLIDNLFHEFNTDISYMNISLSDFGFDNYG